MPQVVDATGNPAPAARAAGFCLRTWMLAERLGRPMIADVFARTVCYQMPKESELSWDAWQGFLRAHKLVKDRMDNELRDSVPLTLAEYDVLFEIETMGGRVRLIELSKRVHLSQSRVSRQIAALDSKGYVTRGNTSFDKRATFAVITSAGRKVLRKAEGPLRRAWHRHFLHHIPPSRLAVMKELMLGLIAERGEWQYDEDPALKREHPAP